MKLLIVEDEYYTRKALIKIVKEKYKEVEVILEAENGEEAVNILDNCGVSIIITDIRMPIMNGLELTAFVRERYPKTMVIIITGYCEFEYAQKALKLNVKDYILKPLQKEEIYQTLDLIIQEVESDQNKEKHESSLQKTVEEVVAHQKLNLILQKKGDIGEQDLLDLLSLESGEVFFRVMLVRNKRVYTEATKQRLNQLFSEKDQIKLYYDLTNRNEMIIFSYGDLTRKQYEEGNQMKHRYAIYKVLLAEEGEDFVVGVSRIQDNINRFPIAYQEAQLATYNYFFGGWGKMHFYETEITSAEQMGQWNELFRIFEHGLKSGDEILSKQMAKKIFDMIQQTQDHGPKMIQLIASKFERIVNEISKECNMEFARSVNFGHYTQLKEFVCYINSVIESICKSIQLLASDKTIVQDILEYMQQNYYDNLSLGEIASEIYFMNASYLSRIFKEEIGETFSKTLMGIRMNKAKELLGERTMNVTEVASLVGFDNVAYFIKAFKSFYHITPGQMRKEDEDPK